MSEESVRKSAQPGSLMFRRRDIIHLFSRSCARSVKAMHLARDEGRYDDADIFQARVRALNSIREELFTKVPIFVNAVEVEACAADHEYEGAAPPALATASKEGGE